MGFRTHKFHDPKANFILQSQQRLYNSPYEAMQAAFNLGSGFDADGEFSTTGALNDMYQKARVRSEEDWKPKEQIPTMSAEEANAKYRPPTPYEGDVRIDIAEFDHQRRTKNQKLKNVLQNVGPDRMGSSVLPFIGAIGGGFTDPAALAMDLAAGLLGPVTAAGRFGARAARIAKIVGYGSKATKFKGILPSLGRNFVENLAPEAVIAMRNVQVGENQDLDDFITNLSAGAVAGTILEQGIDAIKNFRRTPEAPPPTPETPLLEPPQEVKLLGPPPFQYKDVDEMVKMNTLTNDYLVDSGYKPIDFMPDYGDNATIQLKDHIGNRNNRLGRDRIFEKRLSQDYERVIPQFVPDRVRELEVNPVDFYMPFYDNVGKRMDYISKQLEDAEKAEIARVEKAKTEAPTDEGFELRARDIKYRNKVSQFYDNMGGDINEMRNIQEALYEQVGDLTPKMKEYLNLVEDSIRSFGKRSHEKLTKKPADKVSIYNEAYDTMANDYLKKWGFDERYKTVAEEAAEQGARVTTTVDLDTLPGELDIELSPQEIIERVKEAFDTEPEPIREINEAREAHATRMKELDAAQKELVESIKKEKYIDDIVDLMEQAELEADPAVRMELKETIEEYQQAMKEAMDPDEFRDVMDSLYGCIKGR